MVVEGGDDKKEVDDGEMMIMVVDKTMIFMIILVITLIAITMTHREETEIIEGEVVEVQVDRPANETVRLLITLINHNHNCNNSRHRLDPFPC